MRGIWLEDGEVRVREDLPVPVPAPGEARVRVLAAGVCNTDLEMMRGYHPFRGVMGHELVGVVEEGPEELLGRRVVGEINVSCGEDEEPCSECAAGRPTHCRRRTVLGIRGRDGVFAEYAVLPVRNLHPVPEGVSTTAAVFTEPLAAALRIQEQVAVDADRRVLVVGDGKLAQLIARTLALTGCELTVLGRHASKLRLLETRGIRTLRGRAPEEKGFDVAVEATGNPEGFETARRALRPRGTLVMKSTYAGRLHLDASALVVDELTLVGSRCGPFPPALDLLERGEVEVESLVEARYALRDGREALARAASRGALKVLIEMS